LKTSKLLFLPVIIAVSLAQTFITNPDKKALTVTQRTIEAECDPTEAGKIYLYQNMATNGDGKYNMALNNQKMSDDIPQPASMSFALGLMGGVLHDTTACSWDLAQKRDPTFVMTYPIADFNTDPLDYFLIPPIPSIMGMHSAGEFFHPRTRICCPDTKDGNIIGVAKSDKVANYVFMEIDDYANACVTKIQMKTYSDDIQLKVKTSAIIDKHVIYGSMYANPVIKTEVEATAPAPSTLSVDTDALTELRTLMVNVYPKVYEVPSVIIQPGGGIDYTLKQLTDDVAGRKVLGKDVRVLPIVPDKRELYLSDTEFEKTFGMTKIKFASLAQWKQSSAKSAKGLL